MLWRSKRRWEDNIDRPGTGGQTTWNPAFSRNLKEREETQVISLLILLWDTQIPSEGEDIRIWKASRSGSFSISSFYSALTGREGGRSSLANIWRFKAPLRVVAFGWIALRRRILNLDYLRKRGKIVVNVCLLCLEDEETVDNLLLRCRCAVKIWNTIISWFGSKWDLPKLFQHLFEAWKSPIGYPRVKEP